jgi:hypothetical protein
VRTDALVWDDELTLTLCNGDGHVHHTQRFVADEADEEGAVRPSSPVRHKTKRRRSLSPRPAGSDGDGGGGGSASGSGRLLSARGGAATREEVNVVDLTVERDAAEQGGGAGAGVSGPSTPPPMGTSDDGAAAGKAKAKHSNQLKESKAVAKVRVCMCGSVCGRGAVGVQRMDGLRASW